MFRVALVIRTTQYPHESSQRTHVYPVPCIGLHRRTSSSLYDLIDDFLVPCMDSIQLSV